MFFWTKSCWGRCLELSLVSCQRHMDRILSKFALSNFHQAEIQPGVASGLVVLLGKIFSWNFWWRSVRTGQNHAVAITAILFFFCCVSCSHNVSEFPLLCPNNAPHWTCWGVLPCGLVFRGSMWSILCTASRVKHCIYWVHWGFV